MIKAIVFDFDGTLTKRNQNIWKMLWEACGYTTDKQSLYAKLYVKHVITKEITRKQWFDLTCEAFKRKNLTYFDFYEVLLCKRSKTSWKGKNHGRTSGDSAVKKRRGQFFINERKGCLF